MNPLESGAIACDSHVTKNLPDSKRHPEYHETRVISWETGETTLKAKYSLATDSEPVP